MYGYIASHNWGKTLVLSDGRVFEWREQPGGGGAWHEQHGEKVTDIDAYLQQSADEWGADWTELQGLKEVYDEIGDLVFTDALLEEIENDGHRWMRQQPPTVHDADTDAEVTRRYEFSWRDDGYDTVYQAFERGTLR